MSSGLNFFTNELNKTPGSTGSWVDVDVSGDGVPVGATGVILRLANTDASQQALAVRKNGSTDTRAPRVGAGCHIGAMVGIDANRVFEAYIGDADCRVYLVGYTTDGTDFFTNSIDKTPGTAGSWQDIDVSANVPADAVGVLVEVFDSASGGDQRGGVRKNGSTDELTYGPVTYYRHLYQAVGVDANRYLEGKIYATSVKLYLVGYFKAPVSFETNAVSYALGATGAWTDIAVTGGGSPADADGAIWLVKNVEYSNSGGTRKDGSGDESYGGIEPSACPGFFTGLGASRLAEGKVSATSVDHYVIGYARPAGATQKTIADALALADAAPGVAARLAVAEGLGLTDALPGGTPKALLSLTEALSLAEALPSGTPKAFLSLAEVLALADALSVNTGAVQKLVTDALALAETLSLKASVSLTQGLNLSDALGTTARLTLGDALVLVEMVSPKQFKSIAASLALADQVAAAVLAVRLLVLASLAKEGLGMSGTAGPALTLSAISGRGLQLESTMKGG